VSSSSGWAKMVRTKVATSTRWDVKPGRPSGLETTAVDRSQPERHALVDLTARTCSSAPTCRYALTAHDKVPRYLS
jgi:hypothetical protein